MTAQVPVSKLKKHRAIRALLIVAGSISLGLGTIGIFIPVLPTTPFLLISAACYMRSSERLLNWLLNNRWFGKYIKNYQEGRGIPKTTKIIALSFLWITILYSTFFVLNEILIAQVVLILIAVGVSIHLIRTPTFKVNAKADDQAVYGKH
jgi:uncharacterized membrane protein YbaN (DUF454 family)